MKRRGFCCNFNNVCCFAANLRSHPSFPCKTGGQCALGHVASNYRPFFAKVVTSMVFHDGATSDAPIDVASSPLSFLEKGSCEGKRSGHYPIFRPSKSKTEENS